MAPIDLADDASRKVALSRIEDGIIAATRNDVELFLLLDQSGTPLLTKLGQRHVTENRVLHSVALSRRELLPYIGIGYLFTHNHPNGSSFTPEDVVTMSFLRVREGNAFDVDNRYRLIRLIDSWPSETAIRREASVLEGEVMQMQVELVRRGQLSPADAAASHYHLVWTLFAERHHGRYAYVREAR